MSISQTFVADFESETDNTRTLLTAVPQAQFAWRPHAKSMSLAQLAGHIAETPSWLHSMLEPEMDFAAMAGSYTPYVPTSQADLLRAFESNLRGVRPSLEGRDDGFMRATWTMRMGSKVLLQQPRIDALRSTLLHHLAHHRGQLTVYLRLLDVPVPPTYGPTADHPSF
jgi:uncharacterized damage-inducible protein DinB